MNPIKSLVTPLLLLLLIICPAIFPADLYIRLASMQLLLFFILLITFIKQYNETIHFPISILSIGILLLWIWMGISTWISPISFIPLAGFFLIGTLPVCFWLLCISSDINKNWRVIELVIIALGICLAIYACIQKTYLQNAIPTSTFVVGNSFAAFLNLIIMLTLYHFIKPNEKYRYVFAVILLLFFFVIAMIASRGAMLGLAIALLIVLFSNYKQLKKSTILTVVIVLLLAFAISYLINQQFLLSKLNQMISINHNEFTKNTARMPLWRASWQLLQSSPWYGTGLTTYKELYAAFMPINDTSAGQYAHNDYLQFWIELGYPGLILIIAIIIGSLKEFICALSLKEKKLEATIMFAGVCAVAVHSLFTFNFYILATLILTGCFLGRLQYLTKQSALRWTPSQTNNHSIYNLIFVVLFVIVAGILTMSASMMVIHTRGVAKLQQGQPEKAMQDFILAGNLYDSARVQNGKALIYISALMSTPKTARNKRLKQFNLARKSIDQAYQLDPYNRNVPYTKALLYQHATGIIPDWKNKTDAAFQQTLKLDPRYYQARLLYANFLIEQGRQQQAYKLLDQGQVYSYHASPQLIKYLDFIIKVKQQQHNTAAVKQLMKARREAIEKLKQE